MTLREDKVDPIWDDLDWAMGQLFMMGWEGTEVTPQIRKLIVEDHLGAVLLTTKNLKSAQETARLVQELQTIAHQAGHPIPLTIALDQEQGGVNSLYDETFISQFPSAMGIAATGSPEMAFDVAKATALEMSAVGVNMILGPVLDVLTNARYQPIGVRTSGDDPQEVSQYGIASMNGYRDGGLSTCGKHFPSYGNLDFLGSTLDMPIITETLEQLSLSALVPFRNAIQAGLDAIFVGGVAKGCAITNASMSVMHACLSDQVVTELLRKDLGFEGVAISECLEMESLTKDIGVRGGTVMAVEAGCDLVLLCRSFPVQQEAISGMRLGIENEMITTERIHTSLNRVLRMKARTTSWAKALNPPGINLLSTLQPSHSALSTKVYDHSITVMRDKDHLLPLINIMDANEELLLLTPLIKPLPASAALKKFSTGSKLAGAEHDSWRQRTSVMSGEGVFRELGRSLARQRRGKVLHTSYTANGVRPVHENLISRASAIIIVTADANRNLYQTGFTKHVSMMCQTMLSASGKKKSLVVVSVSSPYDFAMDKSIGTYVCTFDFTETALAALVRVLFGEFTAQGTLPGALRKSRKVHKSRQNWLVETFNKQRDSIPLDALIKSVEKAAVNQQTELNGSSAATFLLNNDAVEENHLVVRNSSTQALYGFCSTYYWDGIGMIGGIFVDPAKRNLSIGHSLHQRAIRALLRKKGITKLQLGLGMPGVYLGVPTTDRAEANHLMRWFANMGWTSEMSRHLSTMIIRDLSSWTPPETLVKTVQHAPIEFDLMQGLENAESVLEHVQKFSSPDILELYKIALQDFGTCGVVRAKNPNDGVLIGSVIVCRPGSNISTFVPSLSQLYDLDNSTGGIVAPVVAHTTIQASTVLHGLILLGIRQNKIHLLLSSILTYVDGDTNRDSLSAIGFEMIRSFEQISCSPASMNLV